MVEADGLEPEQTPPASTRWTDEGDGADADDLVPPYLPGAERSREPAESEGSRASAAPAAAPETPPAEPADDAFPVEAFDIEGGTSPGEGAIGATPTEAVGHARADDVMRELADRLEALAGRIRTRGDAAIEAELESDEAFSRLLGGMLAGYVAGRQD